MRLALTLGDLTPLLPSRGGKGAGGLGLRFPLAAAIVALAPRLAEAHAITGTNSWTDELVCAVPTAIMLVLVFVLGRPTRKKTDLPPSEPPEERISE